MATATIFEAKTNLSALLQKVQKGETIVITSGRAKKPVAKLAPIESAPPIARKRLGSMLISGFVPTDEIFEPLPRDWDGTEE